MPKTLTNEEMQAALAAQKTPSAPTATTPQATQTNRPKKVLSNAEMQAALGGGRVEQPAMAPPEPKTPGVFSYLAQGYKSGVQGNVERMKGFLKEAGSFGYRLGELGTDIGGVLSGAVDKARGVKREGSSFIEESVARPEMLTPKGPEQEQGAMVENIAEFLVPGPGKARTAASATKAPFLTKALGVGGKIIEEGLEQGARGAIAEGGTENLLTDVGTGAAVPVVGKALKLGGNILSKVAKTVASKLSGVPTAAIEEAFKNPKIVSDAITKMASDQELGPQKVLNFAEQSFDDLLKNRSATYRAGLKKVEDETMQTKAGKWYVKKFDPELGQTLFVPVDFTLKGVKDTATKALKEFGGMAKGKNIDLSDVPLPNSYKNDLKEVVDKVYNWKKLSPLGMDDLRENLDVFYRRSPTPSPADLKFNAILSKIKGNLSDYTAEKVPQIREMNKQFAAESDTINLLRQELSLGRDKPGTVTRKLMNIFNPKSSSYLNLINELGEQKASDLRADIAGLLMSKWTPEGLGAYLTTAMAGAGGVMSALNPATLPATIAGAAAASPRIVGAAATTAGKLAKKIPERAGEVVSKAAKAIGSQITD